MPKKDTDFSEADFKKEINKILKSIDVPLDPDGNYPDEVKELWPAIQSKLGKKLLAKNWRVWTTMWTNVIGPTYVSAAKEAAKYAGVKYKGEIGSFAKKYHRDHGLALCKTLTETDLQRVQDQIVDNWGIGEKAFEKKFQDDYIGSEARLKTIYRSEHARAISEGTLEVGQEVGHQYKQWWCAEDERSCEICMAHHEETVPMDEAFSGGFAIPQDSHPSCRCVLITLEESDLSDDQKARMASRDPISLDDLDPTYENSLWKSNEAFRQILNYKCKSGTVDDSNRCDLITDNLNGNLKLSSIENKIIQELHPDIKISNVEKGIIYSDDKVISKITGTRSSTPVSQDLSKEMHSNFGKYNLMHTHQPNSTQNVLTPSAGDIRLASEVGGIHYVITDRYLYRYEFPDKTPAPNFPDSWRKWSDSNKSRERESEDFDNAWAKISIRISELNKRFPDNPAFATKDQRNEIAHRALVSFAKKIGMKYERLDFRGDKIKEHSAFNQKLNYPISLDDLDPTFQNSPWKSNEAFRQVLNYKCPENSHGPGFSCGGEETLENEHVPEKQNSILKAAVQSAFEIALKTDVSKIKFNWNCKDSEKNGTGPGSCKDADNSKDTESSSKKSKLPNNTVRIQKYAKILQSKVPDKHESQVYLVRMGRPREDKDHIDDVNGTVFAGHDKQKLIELALKSSKDSGNLIVGRITKDAFYKEELEQIEKDGHVIAPAGYLGQSSAPVDTVIDTATGETKYKRSQDELNSEFGKFKEEEEFKIKAEQNVALDAYRNFGYQSINNVLRGNYVTDKSQKKDYTDTREVYDEKLVEKAKQSAIQISSAMNPSEKPMKLYRVDGSAVTATLFESLGITKELQEHFKQNNIPYGSVKAEQILLWNMEGGLKAPNGSSWDSYLTDKLKDTEFRDPAFSSTSKSESGIKKDLLVPSRDLSAYGVTGLLEIHAPKGTKSIDMQERLGEGEGRYKTEREVLLDKNTIYKIKSVKIEPGDGGIYARIKVDAIQKDEPKENGFLKSIVQKVFESALQSGATKIKFNANCPESEKVGSGPGSCGGKTLEKSLYSSLSKKSQATMKKYKMKGELKKAKTSIMASLVKSTSDEKTSLENAKINASIFKGMTAEEADELTGDAAQEHTNWLMDKGAYYDIKQGISEPMLEDTEELHRRGWNVNGTYHPDIPKKSILDDAAAKIFTYKDEQGRFHKNAELIDAVEEYTGDLYDMYNKVSAGNLPREFLKLTPEDQKELKDRIDNFAAALNTAELPEPVVTYRGIRETTLKRLEQIGASEIGSEFQVNYFQSTTLNYETTKSFMGKDSKGRSLRIQIKLPKGTPAAYVDGFSANNGEDEVLVNRNLKYRCVDVKETDATKTLVWEALL